MPRNRIGMAIILAVCSGARAEQSGNLTLAVGQSVSLDANASGTEDIFWNGKELVPLGRAEVFSLGKYGARVFKAIHARSAASVKYSANPIPAEALVPGEIFGVHTNTGSYTKVRVTVVDGASLTLVYTTFTSNTPAASPLAVGPPPFIFAIQNNYSYLLPGAPGYGIAPGSIFVVQGQNLNANFTPVLQSSAAPGLPLSLNQTSLSVTVNGVTTTPALYYVSSNAVAAVLPSNTPVGTGVLTLHSNGQTAQAPIQVVATAVGLDTLFGNGAGAGVATDSNFNVLAFSNSAKPGQAFTLWGSGVGADPENDDRTYPQTENNLTDVPVQVYVGGISATVLYRGRSAYPGLDQINAVVPSNIAPGCFVSVVVQTNLIVSNTVTIPVAPTGGTCSDPALGLSGAQLQTLAGKGTTPVKSLALTLSQQTNLAGKVNDSAFVLSSSVASAQFGSGNYYSSQGSCVVFQSGLGFPFQSPLDAGTVQLAGPVGNLTLESEGGFYAGQLASNSLGSNPGTYTFTGSGGKDVGAFTVNVTVPAPFSLLNQTGLASISRAQGATVTWSRGPSAGDVMVNADGASANGSVNIFCHAPSGAGQLTIPPSALLAIPPGNGKLVVTSATIPEAVSATGLDLGLATAVTTYEMFTSFK